VDTGGVSGVRVLGVRKRFSRSGPWVLDGVDAELAAGAVTLVIGGNGCGKSTLLRTVAGASAPSAGRVLRPPGPVGYVPERLPEEIRMTARQYVRHMGRLRRLPAVDARADELFALLGLQPGPQWPVGELSKGNSQKVALVQALLGPTRVLVLDEPYAGLDPAAAEALTGLVLAARESGTAVLLSGHAADVFPAADTVLELAGGRLAPAGPARTRLVLRRLVPSAPPPADGAWDEGRQLLVVVTASPDAVLRAALAGGWSFVEGVRA
jgi:ABC-2 type transport system ATP-binding protein